MTFEEIINIVTSSQPADWHTTGCWGAHSGPSYRDHFSFFQIYDGHPNVLLVESHPYVSCYKPNVSINLAWGLDSLRDFKEPWANAFPDPNASSHFVDIFFNSVLVYRTVYVTVDGGRSYLPLPKNREELVVPSGYSDLIRLIDNIGGKISEYDRYFDQAGFKIDHHPWPEEMN
jgi:hypothetical protein